MMRRGVVLAVGLVGCVCANACPPDEDLSALCSGDPVELPFFIGKAQECLLGPSRVSHAADLPLSKMKHDLLPQFAAARHAILVAAMTSIPGQPSIANVNEVPTETVISHASCVKVSVAVADRIARSEAVARYRALRDCGERALLRLPAHGSSPNSDASVENIVMHVSSSLAQNSQMHVDFLCSVLDPPAMWQQARDALTNASNMDSAEDTCPSLDKDTGSAAREAGANGCSREGGPGSDSAVACTVETWRTTCSNASATDRTVALQMRSPKAAAALDTVLRQAWGHVEEFVSNEAISASLALMGGAGPLHMFFDPVSKKMIDNHQQLHKRISGRMLEGWSAPRIALDARNMHAENKAIIACRSNIETCAPEAIAAVERIFVDVLLRPPDDGALAAYTPQVQSTGSWLFVRRDLLDSAEYAEVCKGGPRAAPRPTCLQAKQIVNRMYQDALGRGVDEGGLGYMRQVALAERTATEVRRELETSNEYMAMSAGPKRTAVAAVTMIRAHYADCGGELGELRGVEGGSSAPAQNWSEAYWNGRWCDRRGCDDSGREKCGVFPAAAYQLVQARVWGGVEIKELLREDEQGRAVAVKEELLLRFDAALGELTRSYVDLLGRFPDVAALLNVGRQLADEVMASESNRGGVLSSVKSDLEASGERAEKLALASSLSHGDAKVWRDRASILAGLLVRKGIELPRSVAACFSLDKGVWRLVDERSSSTSFVSALSGMLGVGGTECGRVGTLVKILQETWNAQAPLLGAVPQGQGGGAREGEAEEGCLTPVALYVHQRPHYFAQVLEALSHVEGIGRVCALIVSLDSVNTEMIDLALAIDFAPVRLIFHPVREDLVPMAPVVAIKKHWIWLQDQVWTQVAETRAHKGHVALLEEDHIVTRDYLTVLTRLVRMQDHHCPACWGVTVRWGCMHDNDADVRKVCRSHSVINTGIAFSRDTYDAIKASDFENFADGWDWALFHLAQTGQIGGRDMMLGPAVSRVSNIGREGATVSADAADPHVLKQLNYNNVGNQSVAVEEMYLHVADGAVEGDRQYTPPCWEPLYLGSVGFISQV